ncbi:MAG: hypothetical protein MRERV_35c029 [Mycoplasmataceae bacterium RV_VA103A]|nr:MAG: hypothetical protein MRERV_35c029 [Mycoplasmataceae bacterium RV_VA103A]
MLTLLFNSSLACCSLLPVNNKTFIHFLLYFPVKCLAFSFSLQEWQEIFLCWHS